MKIIKKEKMDVKKFMEEMKANRTNRSYTSLENRNRPTTEEVNYPDKQVVNKYSINSNENELLRSSNLQAQGLRYNYDQNIRNCQPAYPPYIPPRMNQFAMTQQSQAFTASPPYQHPNFMNYSQSFNSPVANFSIVPQDASFHQPGYSGEVNYGMSYSQARRTRSKESVSNHLNQTHERVNNFQNQMNSRIHEQNMNQNQSCQFARKSLQKPKELSMKKADLSIEKQQNAKKQQKKPRKQREKKKKKAPIQLEITESPQQNLKIEEKEEQEEKEEILEVKTFSISRKFDEILLLEKKRIEERRNQESSFKDIMNSFNGRIDNIASNYFSTSILQNLASFEQKISLHFETEFDIAEDDFGVKLNLFEASMRKRLANLS